MSIVLRATYFLLISVRPIFPELPFLNTRRSIVQSLNGFAMINAALKKMDLWKLISTFLERSLYLPASSQDGRKAIPASIRLTKADTCVAPRSKSNRGTFVARLLTFDKSVHLYPVSQPASRASQQSKASQRSRRSQQHRLSSRKNHIGIDSRISKPHIFLPSFR